MRAAFFTLGCKVNQYESSVIEGQFSAVGFDIVDSGEDADVYVVNSCTVTAVSDKKCRQAIRHFRRRNPAAVICLVGCLPQAFPEAAQALPEADVILGAGNRARLLPAVRERLSGGGRIVEINPHQKGESFEPMRSTGLFSRTRAFVKIQDGCERYCAYCIIPHARGSIRSKTLEDLKEELVGLAENGYREIVLVGINLSSYGLDLGLRLLDAISLACRVEGIERVRLGSLEPELLTDEEIKSMSRLDKLCPQFHLSLQSGCDATLKRMNRHYDTDEYRRIAAGIRNCFTDSAITTDIMVGFPGETEREFAQSCHFVEEIGFARAHVFAYSKRPGTPAAKMDGQVLAAEKNRRSREMIVLAGRSQQEFLISQTGREVKVLFETRLPDGRWVGYSENYTIVRTMSLENLSGTIRTVRLLEVDGDGCCGILTDS